MTKATFSVRNFEQFQHYKDRNPVWIKLYNSLLEDYEFGLLPDASKAHLIAIWLLASRFKNLIPLDGKWVAKKINATSTVDLTILKNAGFIQYNQECSNLLADCYQNAIPEKRREREQVREETEKKEAAPPAQLFVLPDFIPGPAWDDFMEMRRKNRKPATEKAKALLASSLEKLMIGGDDPAEILNQSTLNGWTDIYPLKHKGNGHAKRPTAHENFAIGAYLAAEAADRKQEN